MANKVTPPKPGVAPKKGQAPQPPDRPPRDARSAAKLWNERLTVAGKDYDAWAKEYRVERLAKYYLGKQWHGVAEPDAERKYTVNLIFATVETQLPSLMFSKPKVSVEPRPGHADTAGSDAPARATLIESTLQTFIDDPKLHFKAQTTLALRDTYWRFGLIEVGYTADYVDNPNAGKPVLKEKTDEPLQDGAGQDVLQPERLPKAGSETLYVKRIPPRSFRTSPGRYVLEENDWAAYCEWHYVSDVKANAEYQYTAELKPTGHVASATSDDDDTTAPERDRHVGMVKLWKIWDFRTKVRHVLAEGHDRLLQEGKPFTIFPIAALKFYEIADTESFYPLPPLFNWLSPQDEINESREMQRVHRKRAVRRYMREPSVLPSEFEKLETGEDMVCIEVPKVNPSPILPIPDAPLDNANWTQLEATREDFMEITGVSGEARGIPQSDTATQANIINVRAQIRESSARVQVATWLAGIARLMLLTIRDRMQLPFMVKMNVDPYALPKAPLGAMKDVIGTGQTWQQVEGKELGDLDVDVTIDVASLSPVAEDAQRAQWNVVLQLLTNQPLLMLLMTPNPDAPTEPSPMLRKTLSLYGIKSETEVREIWRVGQAALQMMMMQAMAAMVAKGAGGSTGSPGLSMLPGGASAPGQPSQPNTGLPAAGPSMVG